MAPEHKSTPPSLPASKAQKKAFGARQFVPMPDPGTQGDPCPRCGHKGPIISLLLSAFHGLLRSIIRSGFSPLHRRKYGAKVFLPKETSEDLREPAKKKLHLRSSTFLLPLLRSTSHTVFPPLAVVQETSAFYDRYTRISWITEGSVHDSILWSKGSIQGDTVHR